MANTNTKYCIDCYLPERGEYFDGEKVEFYEPTGGRGWQHCQRCKRCEDLYVHEFMLEYPNTKTLKYRKVNLSEEDVKKAKYQQYIKFHEEGSYDEWNL